MVGPDISQEAQEQVIFQMFAKAAKLPVVSGSIRSQPPRSKPPLTPDILCEVQGRGPVAFELVEIVTPALARSLGDGQKLNEAFHTACERHSEIATRFHDAHIYIGFLSHISIQQRLSVVPEVVDVLLQDSENSTGYVEVPHKLQKILAEISVSRGVSDGPAFDVMEMTEHTEEIFVQIEKKCKKKYSSDHSIELLAHYTSQPSSNSFDWQSKFHDYILKVLPGCPFERVWVYDNWSKAIMYVYPPFG
ncbi:MAG: hypothetical protein NW202_06435 [Nitrospira sp.]|nr:hypothetical protein [Nitrospira sp.]